MTAPRRIVVIDAKGAVHGYSTDLPAMQLGDSVRVTMTADGGFDVVSLRSVEVDTTFDTFVLWQDTHGDSSKASWLTVWADAPEQENDR